MTPTPFLDSARTETRAHATAAIDAVLGRLHLDRGRTEADLTAHLRLDDPRWVTGVDATLRTLQARGWVLKRDDRWYRVRLRIEDWVAGIAARGALSRHDIEALHGASSVEAWLDGLTPARRNALSRIEIGVLRQILPVQS